MIYDHIKNLDKYLPGTLVQQIDHFLKNCPTEDKLYQLNGLHVITSTYHPRRFNDAAYESHFKYIDLQIMLQGTETIFYHPICELCPETTDLDRDIAFYKKADLGIGLPITQQMFMLLFPQDGHLPSVGENGDMLLKKAVFKIPLDS